MNALPTIGLLLISNTFMTIAWYGNLKFPDARLPVVIVASWAIAFVEYCFAVPANRLGYAHGLSGGQLKVIQEVITMTIFAGFAILYLKEPLSWRYAGAFACLVGAAGFMFVGKS
ncbi:DMT family protein [Sphingomonas sp. ASV193]|uniref:DMT family protein n=1 Tax=Sphingomonas sp. ASV193 TaxID=3144405 RepID=UPI0032E8E080